MAHYPPLTADREIRVFVSSTSEFVRRGENLVQVGQSGMGKSHLIQGVGRRLCMPGYRVRYVTSAKLVQELAKSRVDIYRR